MRRARRPRVTLVFPMTEVHESWQHAIIPILPSGVSWLLDDHKVNIGLLPYIIGKTLVTFFHLVPISRMKRRVFPDDSSNLRCAVPSPRASLTPETLMGCVEPIHLGCPQRAQYDAMCAILKF